MAAFRRIRGDDGEHKRAEQTEQNNQAVSVPLYQMLEAMHHFLAYQTKRERREEEICPFFSVSYQLWMEFFKENTFSHINYISRWSLTEDKVLLCWNMLKDKKKHKRMCSMWAIFQTPRLLVRNSLVNWVSGKKKKRKKQFRSTSSKQIIQPQFQSVCFVWGPRLH